MNAPNQATPSIEELKNAKQRGDYTGQFTDDVDNSEEIRAIENDPTQFPNSTRVYIAGQIHPDVKVPHARDPTLRHGAC